MWMYVYYIMELIPFVCLFVCLSVSIKLLSTGMNHDILYIVVSRILRSRFIWYFQDRSDHRPDAIIQKPDTGRKNGQKIAVFLWVFEQLKVFSYRKIAYLPVVDTFILFIQTHCLPSSCLLKYPIAPFRLPLATHKHAHVRSMYDTSA